MERTKECKGCKEKKPLTEFDKSKTCKGGFVHKCRACRREESRDYYDNNFKSTRYHK